MNQDKAKQQKGASVPTGSALQTRSLEGTVIVGMLLYWLAGIVL